MKDKERYNAYYNDAKDHYNNENKEIDLSIIIKTQKLENRIFILLLVSIIIFVISAFGFVDSMKYLAWPSFIAIVTCIVLGIQIENRRA